MYRKLSDDVVVIADVSSNIEKLSGGVWMVQWNQQIGYHLVRQQDMSLPEKVYGSNHSIGARIMKTFLANVGKTTGVMLQGAKGTGKTLTAIEVCLAANALKMPVILIQSEFFGSDFNDFLSKIDEPAVIFIDEFEKVFNRQEAINSTLMLLDGAIKTTKLFLMTSNTALTDNNKMEFLQNRPSRVHYVFEYGSIEESVITEYLEDNLEFKVYADEVLALQRAYRLFTIDMLKAIVTEVNRFGSEDGSIKLGEIIKDVNVKTDRGIGSYQYEKYLVIEGKRYELTQFMRPSEMYSLGSWTLEDVIENGGYTSFILDIPKSMIDGGVVESLIDPNTRCLSIEKEIPAYRTESQVCKDILKDLLDGAKDLEHEIEDEGLVKAINGTHGLTESEKEKVVARHHKQQPIATRVVVNFSDHYSDRDEITYRQDPKTRSILVDFGNKGFTLEFKPIIAPAKKETRFII